MIRSFRRALAAVATVFLLGSLCPMLRAAEPESHVSAKAVRDEVRAVVTAQLAALRLGNFHEAYALASSGIKTRFDERLFVAMLRRGYAPLLRSSEPDLGVVRDQNGQQASVTVAFVDEERRNVIYRYWLVKEEGGWRVNGVTPEQLPVRGDL